MSSGSLHEVFREVALRRPREIAVTDADGELTYAQLEHRANQLAHRLIRLGAGSESIVGLCLPRTVDLIVAMVGIAKSGAAYLPLDPRHPVERRRAILADTEAKLLVADPASDLAPGMTVLAPHDASLLTEPDTPPLDASRPESLAYVIYTSGSSGTPKGVAVEHRNVLRLFRAARDVVVFGQEDVWSMFHSAAFDFSVWEIWGALLSGSRLAVVPYEVSRDPAAFMRFLIDTDVTVLSQTPTAFRQLVRAAQDANFPHLALRQVVFGGEELSPPTLREWVEHYGDEAPALINMYGITETTVHVTAHRIRHADLDAPGSPIGRPLSDMHVYLLDSDQRQVPPGEVGEIYVGGAGVSRGYLGLPELTAERFPQDPFGEPGARMYRSGDLAVQDRERGLLYRGRADRQVQMHGFRIEPGEIEAIVRSHPAVHDAIVVLRTADSGIARLTCYWSSRNHAQTGNMSPAQETGTELRAYIARLLPEYMVPGSFVRLEHLPLTANGKLDVSALPEPSASSAPLPPTRGLGSEIEQRLAEIWSELLELDSIDPDDDFFALGGDSILATEMVAEAQAGGINVSIAALFANPTIARLARACAGEGNS